MAILVTIACGTGACGTGDASGGTAAGTDRAEALAGFEPNARVVRIVDGDTIVAALDGREERVRLIGIDTPESAIPDTPPECYGKEASEHLTELIPPGTDILVERDAEIRDRFDRLLGYVYRSSDGLFVNHRMAGDGFAETLRIAPNTTHAAAFATATATARSEGVGMWGAC